MLACPALERHLGRLEKGLSLCLGALFAHFALTTASRPWLARPQQHSHLPSVQAVGYHESIPVKPSENIFT